MPDLDPSDFTPACVVHRNCVSAYRDSTRYVSCKIEHFAETPNRRRFLHLNFMVVFGGDEISLNLTAQFGMPPQIGKRGTSVPAVSLEFSGSDGALSTRKWASAVHSGYAIQFRALDEANLDDLESCIAYMTEVPYFAIVKAEDGTVEKFLVFDPAPDESVTAEFRAAFDALRHEHPSGPAGLPAMLSEVRPRALRHEQSSIRNLARLLRCDPPEVSGRIARIRWSRAIVLSREGGLAQGRDGRDFAITLTEIAQVDASPKTVTIKLLVIPDRGNRTFTYLIKHGTAPDHVRTEDDTFSSKRAWLFGNAGRFNTYAWDNDTTDYAIDQMPLPAGPITLDNCLDPLVSLPYTVVFEAEDGTQWRCLILHDKPAPELIAEAHQALAELEKR